MNNRRYTYFFNDGQETFTIEVDQEVVNSLGGEKSERFQDFLMGVLNGLSEGLYRGSKIIFDFGAMPENAKNLHLFKLNTLTFFIDYSLYLEEIRAKYGNNEDRDHAIAITQWFVGQIFANLGYEIGFAFGGIPGLAGAITASIVYDVKDIGGKTPSEWVGDAARNIINEFSKGDFFKGENNGAIILGLGLQILLEAQAQGYTLSMKNSDFAQYARARAQDLKSRFSKSGAPTSTPTPPSSSPTKGPTSGPSVPPTNFPTKGPSGPMPSSGGSSRGGQAPFAPTSSTPARTYTPPITTRANQPGFAPSFNAPTFNTPFGQRNSAPTFRSNAPNPSFTNNGQPTSNSGFRPNSTPIPKFTPFSQKQESQRPSTSRPSSPFPPINNNRQTPSYSPYTNQPNSRSQRNAPTYYSSYGPFSSPPIYYSSYTRMNDPSWFYTRQSPGDFDNYRQFRNARTKLGSNYNRDNFYRTAGNMGNGWYNYQGQSQQSARARMASGTSARWTQNMRGSIRYAASHVSPLVLDLNCNNEIELLSYRNGVYFDIDNDGFAEKIGWVRPEDGQLARDTNYNGKIDDITELFGDDITTAYYKLSTLDANKDRVIDVKDPAYKELLIWQDKNLNGYSERDELQTLEEAGIESISLETTLIEQEIEGNLISEISFFSYTNGTKCMVADVHYHNDDMNSWYIGKRKLAISAYDTRIKAEIDKFSNQVYLNLQERLDEIATASSSLPLSKMLEAIIQQNLLEYIELLQHYFKLEQERIDLEFSEIEINVRDIEKLSDERFLEVIDKLVRTMNTTRSKELENQKKKAFEMLELEYSQEKDNIKSRYIQKLNEQLEELSKKDLSGDDLEKEKIKVRKALAKEEKIKLARAHDKYMHKYSYIKDSLNYDNEQKNTKLKALKRQFEEDLRNVTRAYETQLELTTRKIERKLNSEFEDEKFKLQNNLNYKVIDKATYKKKLEFLKANLKANIEKALKDLEKSLRKKRDKDTETLKKEFRKKYIIEQKALDETIVKTFEEKLEEEAYLTRQLANKSIKALIGFYIEHYQNQKQNLELYIKTLIPRIEQEAAILYELIASDFTAIQTECLFTSQTSWTKNLYSYFFEDDSIKQKLSKWLQAKISEQFTKDYETEEESIEIDPETLFMPLMRGYGQIPSLHIAMSLNQLLKDKVMELMFLEGIDLRNIQERITNILYMWAGTQNTKHREPIKISANIEKEKIAFIEKLTGQVFKQLGASTFVGQHASTAMQKAWDISLIRATENLLIQGPFTPIFPNASYSFDSDNCELLSSLDTILINAKKFADEKGLSYDFWVQIGYILATHIQELEIPLTILQEKLSAFADEPIRVGLDPFSLVGTNNNDWIKGTAGSDYIKGLEGDDRIDSKEGSDFIEAGDGNDEVFGGEGIDRIYGGNGNDILYGGQNRDFIYGEDGDDKIFGEDGDDDIEGGSGADYLDGGSGRNKLSYGMSAGGVKVNLATKEASGFDAEGDVFVSFTDLGGSEHDDDLRGDEQDNDINGEGGNDTIYGGKGNDYLFGATGNDQLFGEEGDDTLVGFEGPDYMDGGSGQDTVSYYHPYSIVGVKVNLLTGKGFGGYAHGDTYVNLENVEGSKFDDTIIGDNNNNILRGMEGNDKIHGNAGDDTIIDPFGINELYGDDGDDYVVSGISNICYGGNGTDTISYEALLFGVEIDMEKGETSSIIYTSKDKFFEFENAIGTNFNDTIIGNKQNNKIFGLKGDDTIFAGDGNDYIDPGDGNDKVYGGKGNDHIMGGEGADIYDGGDGIDIVDYSNEPKSALYLDLLRTIIKGASFAEGDRIINVEGFIGTKFNDTMIGSDQSDWLFGFDGDDIIRGGAGSDTLSGGKGRNELYGEEDNDIFEIEEGCNIVDGGTGTNSISYQKAKAKVEVDLSKKQGQKSTGEIDTFEDVHNCYGTAYDDLIIGNYEGNKLYGLDGNDYIDGAAGPDTIDGGNGNNTLFGGAGDDIFILIEGNNIVDGGSGNNKIIYSNLENLMQDEYYQILQAEANIRKRQNILSESGQNFSVPALPQLQGVMVNLSTGSAKKPNDLTDQLVRIQSVQGTHYDDYLIGDDQDNILDGVDGNDRIYGGKGNDIIFSGRGHSELYGEEGDDTFYITDDHFGLIHSTASIYGGNGIDTVNFRNYQSPVIINMHEGVISYVNKRDCKMVQVEKISTTMFNDIVYDSNDSDLIETLEGDDTIYLTDGDDYVDSGSGNDIIYFSGIGAKQILGGSGSDTFVIMPNFVSNNKTTTVIGDFSPFQDRFDLSNFSNIMGFENIKIRQFETEEKLIFTVIQIEQNKEIALFGIEEYQITRDCFIFNDQTV